MQICLTFRLQKLNYVRFIRIFSKNSLINSVMKYSIRRNQLHFLFKVKHVKVKTFNILDNEHKYIDSLIDIYFRLSAKDRGKIDLMSNKYSVYRCWYYAKVWLITRDNIKDLVNDSECIDHILPISRGFKNNIAPELIGSPDNIQFLTHKENLCKGTKLTTRGNELLIQFTTT